MRVWLTGCVFARCCEEVAGTVFSMGWHTIRKYLDAPGASARTAAAHAERAEWAPSSSGSGQSFTLSENTSPAPTKATVLVTFSPLTESAENGAFPDSADAQPPRWIRTRSYSAYLPVTDIPTQPFAPALHCVFAANFGRADKPGVK